MDSQAETERTPGAQVGDMLHELIIGMTPGLLAGPLTIITAYTLLTTYGGGDQYTAAMVSTFSGVVVMAVVTYLWIHRLTEVTIDE